jgi:protein gp37
MGQKTGIQWCDSTINPTMGCDGCELWNAKNKTCYAGKLHLIRGKTNSGFADDFDVPERFPGRTAKAARWGDLSGSERQEKPWLGKAPRLIFVSDMGDALSRSIDFQYLMDEIIKPVTSKAGARHRWLWLTKRPGRMAQFSDWLGRRGISWPANLWAGTSVTSPATTRRISQLERVGDDEAVRFLSVEPVLREMDLRLGEHPGVAWVIHGGESGTLAEATPFDLDHARVMRDACGEHGRAYFLKQVGRNPTVGGEVMKLEDGHGGNWDEWPDDLRVRQMPEVLYA